MRIERTVEIDISTDEVVKEIADSPDILMKLSVIQRLMDTMTHDQIDALGNEALFLDLVKPDNPLFGVIERAKAFKRQENILKFGLENIDDLESPKQLTGKIVTSKMGVEIYFDGFGNRTMDPGHAPLMFIENRDGEPTLAIWSRYDSEDPTFRFGFSGAAEPVTK